MAWSPSAANLAPVLPMGLSMLWETSDPGEELRARFGFEDFSSVTDWTRDVSAKHWGLQVWSARGW